MKREKKRFLEIFRKFIEHHTDPVLNEDVRSAATLKNYGVKYNNITLFLQEQKLLKVYPEQFNPVLGNKLFLWCKKKYGHDYSVRTYDLCQMVLNFGVRHGLCKVNLLYGNKYKKRNPKPPVHLSVEDVRAFENYEGSHQNVRDYFLFQCYTGFDYSDTMSVRKHHVFRNPADEREYIIKAREKSKIEAIVPLYQKAYDLWAKYNFQFPRISNQKYNDYLKLIAKDLGINIRVTTHIARKTSTMIKLNIEGYSLEAVSKIHGHASTKTTEMYYARPNLNLVSREMDKLGLLAKNSTFT